MRKEQREVEAEAIIESMKDFFFILKANFQVGELSLTENLKLIRLIDDMEDYVKNQ